MVIKYMLFGQYLLKQGLIKSGDTINARIMQLKNNRRIGDLARERGWLTDEEIDKILVIQEETLEIFGEIAVKEELLTETQIEELLKAQKDSYLFFGEALVQLGAISDEDMKKHLKLFNKLKYSSTDLSGS
ncbi:MAG: hypothetical protein HZC48_11250 [Nitrospirae bacterium]|nr:hypothetical protein [Nitrospirota bacterium]